MHGGLVFSPQGHRQLTHTSLMHAHECVHTHVLTQNISSVLLYTPNYDWKSRNISGGTRDILAALRVGEFAQKLPVFCHFLKVLSLLKFHKLWLTLSERNKWVLQILETAQHTAPCGSCPVLLQSLENRDNRLSAIQGSGLSNSLALFGWSMTLNKSLPFYTLGVLWIKCRQWI